MDLLFYHLENINWWAVVVATLASFAIGGFWYAEPVFGKIWMKSIGLKAKDIQNTNMVKTFGMTAVLALVSAIGLATLMEGMSFSTWQQGAALGASVSLAFVATSRGIHMLFERKAGLTVFLINAGHDLVFLTVAGIIIGLF